MSRRVRFLIWIACVVVLVGGGVAWLYALGRSPGEEPGGWKWTLVVGWALLAGAAGGMAALLRSTPPDAIRLPEGRSRVIILALTAVLVGGAYVWPEPQSLSNDYRRYEVEASMRASGLNPYTRPASEFEAQAGEPPIDHGHLTSIYPPVAQVSFRVAAEIDRQLDAWGIGSPEHTATGLRLLFGVCALASTWLLLLLLKDAGRSPWWAAVVSLSPLVYVETAWSPHVDIVGVTLLLGCLLAQRRGFGFTAGVLLALAAGVKPQVVLLVPFLVRAAGWRSLAGFGVMCAGLAVPFLPTGAAAGFFRTLSIYSTSWEANGSVFELLKSLAPLGDDARAISRLKDLGRLIGPTMIVLVFWVLWKRRAGVAGAAFALQLTLLLTSPVVYPWYLLWVLFLVPLVARGDSVLVWSATIGLSYLLGRLGVGWTLPAWVLLLEYVPVYAVLARDLLRSPAPRELPG